MWRWHQGHACGPSTSEPLKTQSFHIKAIRHHLRAQFSPAEQWPGEHCVHTFPTLPASLSHLAPTCFHDLARPVPPPYACILSLAVACPCWVSANHMHSEGGSCSVYVDDTEHAANYKTHSESLAARRRCYCAASCRVGKMSLSAQSQVAVLSANEVRPWNPHGELHEGRWRWRLRKYT